MTISLSLQDYWELFEETAAIQPNPNVMAVSDHIWAYPNRLGQGYLREIELRKGLYLEIEKVSLHSCMQIVAPEREHSLEFMVFISGARDSDLLGLEAGKYVLYGSGMAPKETSIWMDDKPLYLISVHITPELFRSFIGDQFGQLPDEFITLIREVDQTYYMHSGFTTVAMQVVTQQILQCPHCGIIQRIYWESKVWELLALLLEPLVESQVPDRQDWKLKIDRDRIHQAKEILLQHLNNPITLVDLAHRVGLNTCDLKRGFRQEFGKPVFGYLREYRLEKARQLLDVGDMNVAEVAHAIGYIDRKGFTKAFHKQFGLNPRDYRNQQKNFR
jgi:AraC-like DNA-binding protein